MLLQLYNLDNPSDEIPLCVLSPGEHIIGRGDLLKCHDKRASRKHAIIRIENKYVTITPIHQNPCFYQSAESTTVTILTKDVPAEISDGDKFGIFPDQFWFKTKFSFDTKLPYLTSELNTSPLDVENIPIHKRQLEDNLDNIPSKISKFENHQLASTSNGNHERNESTCETFAVPYEHVNLAVKEVLSSPNIENEPMENCTLKSHNKTNIVNDAQTVNSMNTSDTGSHKPAESVQNITSTDQPIPSSSGTVTGNPIGNDIEKKLRDRCWYGKGCYRKSAHHKKEFSHPGDSDYDSDPNDTRPICRYGADCYRKNADHIKEYKHARITRKPSRKCRDKRKLKGMKKANTTTNEWSDDNDYDYDDPFLNDDSGDNYEEESWSEDDSDEEWVGSGDEDSDDTNSLMKEAKRFTKQN